MSRSVRPKFSSKQFHWVPTRKTNLSKQRQFSIRYISPITSLFHFFDFVIQDGYDDSWIPRE